MSLRSIAKWFSLALVFLTLEGCSSLLDKRVLAVMPVSFKPVDDFEDMIKYGEYKVVGESVLQHRHLFPVKKRTNQEHVRLYLVPAGPISTWKDAQNILDDLGLKAASPEDVLKFGWQYPHVQENAPVTGAPIFVNGKPHLLVLSVDEKNRRSLTFEAMPNTVAMFRYLAVPKE